MGIPEVLSAALRRPTAHCLLDITAGRTLFQVYPGMEGYRVFSPDVAKFQAGSLIPSQLCPLPAGRPRALGSLIYLV